MNDILRKTAAAIAAVSFLLSCSGGESGELLLYCGAGIRPPVDELVKIFEAEEEIKIAVDYAGSEVLLSRIRLARKGDLYLPGDAFYVDQAAAGGMILLRKPVCRFEPVILVPRGNPAKVLGLNDLLRPPVKLGVGDPEACAVGRVSRTIFAGIGKTAEEVAKNTAYLAQTVNDLGVQIKMGSLDAVIVWDAVAACYEDEAETVSIPDEQNIISTADLGVLSFTRNREAAEKFLDLAVSARGREVFRKHGYSTIPPERR